MMGSAEFTSSVLTVILTIWANMLVVFAQTSLSNQGALIRISEGSLLEIQGDLQVEYDGTIDLDGELKLSGDLNHLGILPAIDSTHSTGRVYLNGSGAQVIKGHDLWFPHLKLGNPDHLYLHTSLEIGGVLQLNSGKIFTGNNKLIIQSADPDAISGMNKDRFMVGELQRSIGQGNYLFPVGSQISAEFAEISFQGDDHPGQISVRFIDEAETSPPDLYYRGRKITRFLDHGYWRILPDQPTSEPFQLTLLPENYTNSGNHPDQHIILGRTANGWDPLPPATGPGTFSFGPDGLRAEALNIHQYGDFIIGVMEYALGIKEPGFSQRQVQIAGNGGPDGKVWLNFQDTQVHPYQIVLRNLAGGRMKTFKGISQAGTNIIAIDFSTLPEAIYLLDLQIDGKTIRHKIW